MNKKNDKFLIVIIMMLVFLVFSWFIDVNIFDDTGTLLELGRSQGGLYNIFNLIYSSLIREIDAIIYLFVIGGAYGVLSNTKGYRKIVDKVVEFIQGRETIAFAVVTLLMGVYTSITYEILSLFIVIPFIVSVFLRAKCDKVTAVSAAIGGLFIGYIGQTFGTYAFVDLHEATSVGYGDFMWQKVVMFLIAYVLYNVFAILHMKKKGKKSQMKADLYLPEELIEKKVPKRKKTKAWPTAIVLALTLIIMLIAHISWSESFGISIFAEIHSGFQKLFMINDVPFFSTLVGNGMASLGNWSDLTYASFIIVVATIIVALINKVSISDFTEDFGNGMKKIGKVALIYTLVTSLLYFYANYAWPASIINSLYGNESFNVFTLFIGSFLNVIFCIDPGYSGAVYGPFLTFAFADNITAAAALWRISGAIALTIVPTSMILLCGLTYADISYKKWFKYIWKFTAAMTAITLLFMLIIFYV